MARILIAGLDPDLNEAFSQKFVLLGFQVELVTFEWLSQTADRCDIIFASGDDWRWHTSLARLRANCPSQPFVVVSRSPDDEQWLAALEAGATDYCPLSINTGNLRWILDNALNRNAKTRAA